VRVREVPVAAHHVRYLHQRIVDDAAEIVSRAAVASKEDGIADLRRINLDPAKDQIGKATMPGRTLSRSVERAPFFSDACTSAAERCLHLPE